MKTWRKVKENFPVEDEIWSALEVNPSELLYGGNPFKGVPDPRDK